MIRNFALIFPPKASVFKYVFLGMRQNSKWFIIPCMTLLTGGHTAGRSIWPNLCSGTVSPEPEPEAHIRAVQVILLYPWDSLWRYYM